MIYRYKKYLMDNFQTRFDTFFLDLVKFNYRLQTGNTNGPEFSSAKEVVELLLDFYEKAVLFEIDKEDDASNIVQDPIENAKVEELNKKYLEMYNKIRMTNWMILSEENDDIDDGSDSSSSETSSISSYMSDEPIVEHNYRVLNHLC
jgi:hypothetical protein